MNQFSTKYPFAIRLTFSSINPETKVATEIDALTFEFKLVYIDVVGTQYEVSHIGDIYKNCYVKDGELFARFENHKFSKGKLRKELYVDYVVTDVTAGENFANGYWTNVYPLPTEIEMI